MSVLTFPASKALMLREYKNGTFSMLPWVMAYSANSIFWQVLRCFYFFEMGFFFSAFTDCRCDRWMQVLFSLLLMCPVYFMVGLKLELSVSSHYTPYRCSH